MNCIRIFISSLMGLFVITSSALADPLPRVLEAALLSQGATLVETSPTAIIISESDFKKALEKVPFYKVEPKVRDEAFNLTAKANEANNKGVVGAYRGEGAVQHFSGHLFIVVSDPMVSPDGKFLQATKYKVAAVELSGEAEWIAKSPRFAMGPKPDNSASEVAGRRCCGPPFLAVVDPRPTPQSPFVPATPPCVDPIHGNCAPPEGMGVTETAPPGLEAGLQSGFAPIGLELYATKISSSDFSPPGGGLTNVARQVFNSVHRVLDPGCTNVTPNCREGDEGFRRDRSGSADMGVGSTTCIGGSISRTVYFQDIPKICTIISSDEVARFKGGGKPLLALTCGGVCGGFCNEPSSALGNGLPPGCAMMDPVEGSSICKTPTQQEQEEALKNLQAIAKYTGGAGVSRTCEQATRYGKICTECDKSGCRQIPIRYSVDPGVAAGGAPADKEKSRDEKFNDALDKCKGNSDCIAAVENCKKDDKCEVTSVEGSESAGYFVATNTRGKSGSSAKVPSTTPSKPAGSPPSNPSDPQKGDPPPPNKDKKNKNHKPEDGPIIPDHGKPQDPDPQKAVQLSPSKAGDPVVIGSGALSHEEVDLSFDGPVRPLEFRRLYDSQSGDRSTLGSNWRHNWDQRIILLNPETTPAWALPYCAGSVTTTICIVFRDHRGSQTLFFLDMGSGLFMPQAGSTDTIAQNMDGAWSLRRKDGHELFFNKEGYLTHDLDRFGNGFRIEYEPTPLYRLFQQFCSPDVLGTLTLHDRHCAVLAYLMGKIARPDGAHDGWKVSVVDYPLPSSSPDEELVYARSYFLHVLGLGRGSQSVYGTTRLRPTTVTDDLGRTLRFRYVKGDRVLNIAKEGEEYEFSKKPDAELLELISGPGWTVLQLHYDRPQAHPKRLNEMFLTAIERKDAPQSPDLQPAPDRKTEYRYQWSSYLTLPYDSHAKVVRTSYQAYYETFVGCWLRMQNCPGELSFPKLAPGDPTDLALHQTEGYLSEVADNIIEVINNGDTTLESRYEIDPLSSSFDKVLDQRYGSSLVQQDPKLIQMDLPGDQWRTSLPKASYRYHTSGPLAGGGDRTDRVLPATLRERYPLEESNFRLEEAVSCEPAVGAAPEKDMKSCDYEKMKRLLKELAGYQETLPYFSPLEKETHPNLRGRLYRSRLTCAQLALAQLSDPTHNDLLSDLVPVLATKDQTDHIAERISGHRKSVAADANRICAWTEFLDRDGDLRYYGLNFQGQVLVEAVSENTSKDVIFSEQLYNADGMPVQTRRPTRGKAPWSASAGYTAFTYEELDPKGNDGWNDWIPLYWSRRTNLIRVETIAAGGGVTDDPEPPGGSPTKSLGRYLRIGYEPLFSLVHWVESGTLKEQSTGSGGSTPPLEEYHSRTMIAFDYQELNWEDPVAMKPLLDRFRRWGFGWIVDKNGEYDYKNILGWQLPVKFYNSDLNGDGEQGFPYRSVANGRAVGLPILVQEQPKGLSSDFETTILTYAPHGKPASIQTPAEDVRLFSYYTLGKPGFSQYGGAQAPLANEVSSGFAGFLAKVDVRRFSGIQYDTAQGPNSKSCPHLLGPYQWILPETCPEDVRSELTKLGLQPAFVETIAASSESGSADKWASTALGYSEIGKPRFVWSRRGTTQLTRDVDGRVRKRIDPAGNRTEVVYSVEGNPFIMATFDPQGKVTNTTIQRFDEEGHLINRCEALTEGGCDQVVNLARSPRLSDPVKDGVVNQFSYYAEGALKSSIDPEGLRTEFTRNERKLPIWRWMEQPSTGAASTRSTYFDYTTDGDLEAVHYGVRPNSGAGGPRLSERYEYDGLQRASRHINVRGYSQHWAYTSRDQVTRTKQDDHPYDVIRTTKPGWETTFRHDDYGRVVEEQDNGVITGRYRRGKGGHIFAWSAAGLSETFVTYDGLGNLVWSVDSDGNQMIAGQLLTPEKSFSAQVRQNKSGQQLTTGLTTEFNALGLPTSYTEFGNGFERTWSVIREASGEVRATSGPDGSRTEYERNLLGWPKKISQLTALGGPPAFDHTLLTYNKRGQLTVLTDPAQQVTQWTYTGFGELDGVTIPGQPVIKKSYTYDALGRLEREVRGKYELRYQYDKRGDLSEIGYRQSSVDPFRALTTLRFDELGRNVESVYDNIMLTHLAPAERLVTRQTVYDSLGRVALDSISMGSQQYETKSNWQLVGNRWVRRIDGGLLEEMYDQLGRMESLVRKPVGSRQFKISFDWLGELYIGRTQEQVGRSSPFREIREVGPFGELAKLRYTALDVSASGQPNDQAEGGKYCGGQWNATYCAAPLLSIEAQRDVVGRIVSLSSQFGFPTLNSGTLVPKSHPRMWRGYAFNAMGQLSNVWEHEGMPTPVVTTGLEVTGISPTELAQVANPSGANPVLYDREVHVGSTSKITELNTGATRWGLREPRGPGHQLRNVRLDKQTLKIQHDAMGQVKTDGKRALEFDPLGRLSRVKGQSSQVEHYAYDGEGRLVAVFRGKAKKPDETFRYDGLQMVTSFDAAHQPRWEATWGPGIDHLLAWEDRAGQTGEHIPVTDHRNTVVATWQTKVGGIIHTTDYNPEGRVELSDHTGNVICTERGTGKVCALPSSLPFGYMSSFRSNLSGLMYMRNRWYSTELAQFLSHDPELFSDGFNPYAYAKFDPINFVDPFGSKANNMADNSLQNVYLPNSRRLMEVQELTWQNLLEGRVREDMPASDLMHLKSLGWSCSNIEFKCFKNREQPNMGPAGYREILITARDTLTLGSVGAAASASIQATQQTFRAKALAEAALRANVYLKHPPKSPLVDPPAPTQLGTPPKQLYGPFYHTAPSPSVAAEIVESQVLYGMVRRGFYQGLIPTVKAYSAEGIAMRQGPIPGRTVEFYTTTSPRTSGGFSSSEVEWGPSSYRGPDPSGVGSGTVNGQDVAIIQLINPRVLGMNSK